MPPAAVVLRLVGFVDNAEAVAVGVNEDDEILVRAVLPFIAGRTEAEQPLDLRRLISGIEVKMNAAEFAERRQLVFGGRESNRSSRHESRQ